MLSISKERESKQSFLFCWTKPTFRISKNPWHFIKKIHYIFCIDWGSRYIHLPGLHYSKIRRQCKRVTTKPIHTNWTSLTKSGLGFSNLLTLNWRDHLNEWWWLAFWRSVSSESRWNTLKFFKVIVIPLHCNQCVVHHIKFCPVNLRLISWRALGSLDTSSGGTAVLLCTECAGRKNVLVFIFRLNAFDPADAVWLLCLKRIPPVSSVLLV